MENIASVIIIGTAFTLLIIGLAAFIIFSAQRKKDKLLIEMQELELQKQKEISENTLISQENERQRISMELHDELGPMFAATRMNISRIQNMSHKPDSQEDLRKIAEDAEESLGAAMAQFSNLTRMLYPVILNRFGINEALLDIEAKANAGSDIEFTFNIDDLNIKREVVSTSIYRVCQELCTNASKHSRANSVSIEVHQEPHQILLNYKDDGIGYDTTKVFEGLGLNSILGRINAIGGNLSVESAPNQGVDIKIAIPYEHQH
ncbi:hypothetical protein GYB22_00585 [bacterium]|nr:hypothetical protein [bacterium]